jgi:putative RecB family exonuclease
VDRVFSHSRLSSFEDCKRKFQYRYVLKIPAERESIEAFVGKRVHDVLERLYRAAKRGHVPTLPQVIFRYDQLFEEAFDPRRVRIVRRENPVQFYRDLGEQCLVNYYRAHYPFDADETLGLEERIHFELARREDGPVHIQGFIDRIARARDGAIEIQDYKTSARIPTQAKLDQDRQLALYQIGLTSRFGSSQPIRLVWHFVRSGRTRTSSRTPEQLGRLREDTLRLVDRIHLETGYEPTPGPLCRWCEYCERCPASPERRRDLPTWEDAPPRVAAQAIARRARSRRRRRPPPPGQLELGLGPAGAAPFG